MRVPVELAAATSSEDQVIGQIQDAVDLINALPTDVFKNRNLPRALSHKLLAIINQIESGDYVQARNKLANDVMGMTDGCASDGSPDRNDWIETCEALGRGEALYSAWLVA